MKVFLKWTATLLLLGVLGYSGARLEKKRINAMVEFPEKEVVVVESDCIDLVMYVHEVGKQEINAEKVLTLIDTLNVEHPHIVFAQMRLESGNFKSDLAKNNDNFFGMKYPRQRATVAQGVDRGYAYYRSWSYSVLDYAIWQRRYASGLTEDEYLEMLSEKYAEDKAYVRKVKSIADSISCN